ncbi:hypothetical protein ACO0RG_002012 [Hanseniaspora osmophila]|uniref:Uncharacterized protein n=1 Tax=Hanseniaspora osmophila TaxID=56408 RepID=A0A1E5RI36_9ASCO|nr:hypothetical protein AWRI3579_g1294 [Hanseniaspora osmophila]
MSTTTTSTAPTNWSAAIKSNIPNTKITGKTVHGSTNAGVLHQSAKQTKKTKSSTNNSNSGIADTNTRTTTNHENKDTFKRPVSANGHKANSPSSPGSAHHQTKPYNGDEIRSFLRNKMDYYLKKQKTSNSVTVHSPYMHTGSSSTGDSFFADNDNEDDWGTAGSKKKNKKNKKYVILNDVGRFLQNGKK